MYSSHFARLFSIAGKSQLCWDTKQKQGVWAGQGAVHDPYHHQYHQYSGDARGTISIASSSSGAKAASVGAGSSLPTASAAAPPQHAQLQKFVTARYKNQ
jgi:hypothetical protein